MGIAHLSHRVSIPTSMSALPMSCPDRCVMCRAQREPLERYEQLIDPTFCRRGSLQVLTLDGTLPAPARTFGDALLAIPCSGL
jgi:hypothetical protein